MDYFDREFARADGDWKKVAEEYLFAPDHMLMNGVVGGCEYTTLFSLYVLRLTCP